MNLLRRSSWELRANTGPVRLMAFRLIIESAAASHWLARVDADQGTNYLRANAVEYSPGPDQ